jgi:hypothetical protein
VVICLMGVMRLNDTSLPSRVLPCPVHDHFEVVLGARRR